MRTRNSKRTRFNEIEHEIGNEHEIEHENANENELENNIEI